MIFLSAPDVFDLKTTQVPFPVQSPLSVSVILPLLSAETTPASICDPGPAVMSMEELSALSDSPLMMTSSPVIEIEAVSAAATSPERMTALPFEPRTTLPP